MGATLGQIVQQLVIVVLLATLVDALMPQSALRRDVRLVLSLLILWTMLTPFVQFLQGDHTVLWQELTESLSLLEQDPSGDQLRAVEEAGTRLQTHWKQLAEQQATQRLQQAVLEYVQKQGYAQARVHVTHISQQPYVHIVLGTQSIPVASVDQPEGSTLRSQESMGVGGVPSPSDRSSHTTPSVVQWLADVWNIEARFVTVREQ